MGLDKTSVLKIKLQLDKKYLQNEITREGKYIVHDRHTMFILHLIM